MQWCESNQQLSKCPFNYFSFIPTNVNILIEHLKNINKIDQDLECSDIEQLMITSTTDIEMSNILDFQLKLDGIGEVSCKIVLKRNPPKILEFELGASNQLIIINLIFTIP